MPDHKFITAEEIWAYLWFHIHDCDYMTMRGMVDKLPDPPEPEQTTLW